MAMLAGLLLPASQVLLISQIAITLPRLLLKFSGTRHCLITGRSIERHGFRYFDIYAIENGTRLSLVKVIYQHE